MRNAQLQVNYSRQLLAVQGIQNLRGRGAENMQDLAQLLA
jgi:hypothetical protein